MRYFWRFPEDHWSYPTSLCEKFVVRSQFWLKNAGRIKVINNGRMEHPVQSDSVRGEYASSRPFVNVTGLSDGVLKLLNIDCVKMVESNRVVCPEQRNGQSWISARFGC